MAQELTVNIKTTSDVPQAMDKAKAAASGFDKQVGDISRKFSTAFKDIALGFIAPMVIVNQLVSLISQSIEEAKRSAQEGFDLIAKGETKLATTEQAKLANFLKIKAANKKEAEDVEAGMKKMAIDYSLTKEGGEAKRQFLSEGQNRFLVKSMGMGQPSEEALYQNKDFQKRMLEAFLASEEGKAYQPIFDESKKDPAAVAAAAAQVAAQKASDDAAKAKGTTFKGPEGFSNVVGVGSNPVIEAMNMQLEETRKQTALLEIIARPATGGGVPVDFTKDSSSSTPSRASMLTGN
jgi:hypothetical protein